MTSVARRTMEFKSTERRREQNQRTVPHRRGPYKSFFTVGTSDRRATSLLAEHWRTSPFQGDDELVFCHPQQGTPLDPSKLARGYLRPALARAGITKPFRPFHDLRHTALTHEAAAGNPMAYVQLKAGHSQSAITERYIHAAQVLFPGAAARAEQRMFSAKTS